MAPAIITGFGLALSAWLYEQALNASPENPGCASQTASGGYER